MTLLWALVPILLAVALGLRVFARYPAPPCPLRVLRRAEYATLAAAAEVTFPRGGAVEPSGGDAQIPLYLDGYLALVPSGLRRLVRLLLFLVEHATLVFPASGPRGMRRMSSLSPEVQAAYLRGWEHSRLALRRLVFTSLRSLLGMAYFADPAVLRALNLAPQQISRPVGEADLLWPPVGEPSGSIRFSPADRTPPSDGTPLDPRGPLHPSFREGAR